MKSKFLKFFASVVLVITVTPLVLAQSPAKPLVPVVAPSPVKPLAFESVFDKYQPYNEKDIQSWVQANDTVKERGGWRQYLKESQRARSQP